MKNLKEKSNENSEKINKNTEIIEKIEKIDKNIEFSENIEKINKKSKNINENINKNIDENLIKIESKKNEISVFEEALKSKKVWFGAFRLFFKIIFIFIFCVGFVFSSIFIISPETDAKIFNFLGFTRAEEACYVRIYNKSGSASDLYNLIIFDMNTGDLDGEYLYINEMINRDDYAEFCKKLDASGVLSAGDNKALYVYVADTNAYLIQRQIKICFEKYLEDNSAGWDFSLIKLIRQNLSGDNLTEYSFYTFMRAIVSENSLSTEQKIEFVETLMDTWSEENITLTMDLLLERLNNLDEALSVENDEVDQILLAYSKMRLCEAMYYYYQLVGDEVSEENYLLQYNSAREVYLALI